MICQRCHGKGYLRNVMEPCPECLGSGVASCCDTAGARGEFDIRETRLPACHCLNCGVMLDAATSIQGYNPLETIAKGYTPISICSDCGHIMAYDKTMKFRELTDEEVISIAGDKEVLAISKLAHLWREYKKNRKKKDD